MKELNGKQLRRIRNILIIGGISIAFIIWLAIPAVNGSSFFNTATNDNYSSKMLMLPMLGLPLFALIDGKRKQENYEGNDLDKNNAIEDIEATAAKDQIVYAAIEDVIVITFMTIAFFL